METTYSYEKALAAAQHISWKIDDIIGEDKPLDFSRYFLPESLARVEPLNFLSDDEKRLLNQIRSHGYLYTFGLLEEFILPLVLEHARSGLDMDNLRTRAFQQFVSEEAKPIHLFMRFRDEFVKGFGDACDVIATPEELADQFLSHHPLAAALVSLHIECMTQRHYFESVIDNQALDPQFRSLLRHHWMEEAQLGAPMVYELVREMNSDAIAKGIEEYLKISGYLDDGMKAQAAFDLEAFERAAGRTFDENERERFLDIQHQALRWTYIGTGMTHEQFLATVEQIQPGAKARLMAVAPTFC
jgi:hypothetical protein